MVRSLTTTRLVWSTAPFVVVSATHVVLLALDAPAATVTKLLLMPMLAVPVFVAAPRVREHGSLALLLTALLCSWLGDAVGTLLPSLPELPLMLTFFGLAHIAYIALFARHLLQRRIPRWAGLYAAWWLAMLAMLGPHIGGLLIAVAVYGLVLGGTAALAARCDPVIAAGGALFLASDTILACRLFLPDGLPAWSNPLIMLTYTIGQGLIVTGAVRVIAQRRERSTHA